MNGFALRKKIDSYDFAIYELVLFLDTHPENGRALSMLAKLRQERAEAIKQYEMSYGTYSPTHSAVKAGKRWSWIDGPWPWENEANK